MKEFTRLYADKLTGVLSGFDRLIFRGYLRELSFVRGLFMYLCWREIRLTEFGRFAQHMSEQVKRASLAEATRLKRPVVHLQSSRADKDATARAIANRDKIKDGLICVLSAVEPCRSFGIGPNPTTNRVELRPRHRKCLFLYHYRIDPVFGFIHARIQTWLPLDIQISLLRAINHGEFCINGFRNRDLQKLLFDSKPADPIMGRRRSARVSRQLRMLRAHGLVHKLPHSHRYRLSPRGRQRITALLSATAATMQQLNQLAVAA